MVSHIHNPSEMIDTIPVITGYHCSHAYDWTIKACNPGENGSLMGYWNEPSFEMTTHWSLAVKIQQKWLGARLRYSCGLQSPWECSKRRRISFRSVGWRYQVLQWELCPMNPASLLYLSVVDCHPQILSLSNITLMKSMCLSAWLLAAPSIFVEHDGPSSTSIYRSST